MTAHDDHRRFDDLAAEWDSRPHARERADMIAAAIRDTVPLSPAMRVLEVGGGTGLLSRALVDDIGTAVVTDVSGAMVDVAGEMLADPRYAGWSARRLDIEHDDLPDETFDLVLSQLALHHMGDVPGVIGRLAALLTPGGWVALADLEHDADGGFHRHVHGFSGHHGFSREDLGRWLTAAGLVEVTVGDAGFDVKEVEGEERRFPLLLAAGRRPTP